LGGEGMKCCRNCKYNHSDQKPCAPIVIEAISNEGIDLENEMAAAKSNPDTENNCEYFSKKNRQEGKLYKYKDGEFVEE
jgi:hypothetical protein